MRAVPILPFVQAPLNSFFRAMLVDDSADLLARLGHRV